MVNEALTTLDLGFNEIRVFASFRILIYMLAIFCTVTFWFCVQDDGAFAIAQALKANEDVRITSLNLSRNLMTKFGQVSFHASLDPLNCHLLLLYYFVVFIF